MGNGYQVCMTRLPARVFQEPDLTEIADAKRALEGVQPVATNTLISALDQLAQSMRSAGPLRDQMVAQLQSTGLTREMIAWALATNTNFDPKQAHAFVAQRKARCNINAIILAGNLFTASFSAIAMTLLAGKKAFVKTSQRDPVMAHLIAKALQEIEPKVGSLIRVFTIPRSRKELIAAMIEGCRSVTAYGSQNSLRELRALADNSVKPPTFFEMGHGLGAALIDNPHQGEHNVRQLAASLALDVAAFDQRGCLSPHFVLLRAASNIRADNLAQALIAALDDISRGLPRGPLSMADNMLQLQWRGVAAARGRLLEGKECAVSIEGGQPRVSCGFRNVGIYTVDDFSDALSHVRRFIKRVGIAGRISFAHSQVCNIGDMQTPAFGSLEDGYAHAHMLAALS